MPGDKNTKAQDKRWKRHKAKQIKKILKERLNIDCLRMLCEDGPDEDTSPGGTVSKKPAPIMMNNS